ncbi:MAG: cell division protein FtsL [Alphaproteobacteria bacterium]|nr:cell division protein FtsL [Alphaproteobacteria bacterium]
MKHLAIIGGLVVVGLAVGVYRAKLGAQENEARIETLQGEIERASEEIAVLKAEEAYLTRPERIGPLARERLGLAPASPDQFTAVEMLSRRVGAEAAPVQQPTPGAAEQ